MFNKDIFCIAPWYELQIYWDGGLGVCCQESHRLYSAQENKKYNLANMSITEWINEQPARDLRKQILGDKKISSCQRCYAEEHHGSTSRRFKSNQKLVIFTKENFKESVEQSPGYDKFIGIKPVDKPLDIHIDLGNYCNLACKMCNSQASSKIAAQEVKWGNKLAKQYVGTDWTRDQEVWDRTIEELVSIPNLRNIHFMGGETLVTSRFEDCVDSLISAGKIDTGLSFVTNGTTFNDKLLKKLIKFKRVGIEVSIESLTAHNEYVRQGTVNSEVLSNIELYRQYDNNSSITVTLRPAISSLTIGSYWTLLRYALNNKMLVKGLLALRPLGFHPAVLPFDIRQSYKQHYLDLIADYNLTENTKDYNESDPTNYKEIIYGQIKQVLSLLDSPTIDGIGDLVAHCKKWDAVYNYNAIELYPELAEVFKQHGY